MASAIRSDATSVPKVRKGLEYSRHWLYLAPALFFFVLYQVYPIIRVLVISFTDYHYIRNEPLHFTGFLNYTNALSDPLVWQGLGRALQFTVIFLPGVIFVPLFLAILVDRVKSSRLATT